METTTTPSLTSRQMQILHAIIVDGAESTEQIARQLNIGKETVRTYLRMMYETLGVHTRTQAVLKVLRLGIFTLDS